MERIAIVDCRADDKSVYRLENYGLRVIPTIKIDTLYDAIATHADIQIHYLGENKFVCAPEAFDYYRNQLSDEFTLIKGSLSLKSQYPHDIGYNVATLDKFAICNSRYTAIEILSEYKRMSKEILNAKQGYSKCSICVVNGNAIITADTGIAKSADEHNIDVLRINPGHIELRNMNYGFIGGATGLINKDVLAVNGSLETHPDADAITQFCKKHNVELYPLKDGILTDIGTIIVNFDIQV